MMITACSMPMQIHDNFPFERKGSRIFLGPSFLLYFVMVFGRFFFSTEKSGKIFARFSNAAAHTVRSRPNARCPAEQPSCQAKQKQAPKLEAQGPVPRVVA